jgi:hypothetical protein
MAKMFYFSNVPAVSLTVMPLQIADEFENNRAVNERKIIGK